MVLENLNPNQKKAVLSENGPLLIVAGAGTGKTKTLTSRLIYLLQSGINPQNICAITFTNKAAKEMLDRTIKNIKNPKIVNDLFIGTFHSLGAKILKQEAPILKRNKNFIIFDDNDSFYLIKKIVKNFKTKNSAGYFYNLISKIKNESIHLEEILESGQDDKIILDIFKEYELELEKHNAFDFDDLIQKVVLIFKKNKNILEKYQNQFQYILVDEYQDLNNIQYEMIKLLAQKSKNINVVGDDAQTIYSWRGSNIKIFLNFEHDWPEANIVFLEENYRSTSNILEAAQAIISKNIYQRPKNLFTNNEKGELIKIIETQNEEEEALFVAKEIKKLIKNKNYKSIGILYRINSQSRAIEQALNFEEISYKIFGGIRFYERKEIKDILAGLRFIYNNQDNLSLERLKKILNQKKLNLFFENIKNIKTNSKSPTEFINLFLQNTNYLNYLEKNFTNFNDRLENIKELIYFASGFKTLEEFLEKIALVQPQDNQKNQNAFLELMTIHLAKGVEFDCVFIIGATEGILPHKLSYNKIEEMEEERRLMYVAMTRAKKELFISFYKEPSRFLFDIPQHLIDFQNLSGEKTEFVDDEMNYIHLD
ncbi:MAG: UvrD-helicase domain-containing protein [Patescibacteria group bacterium]|nr:UvrD-helicase domain-containing protein [Patescibacteria group bacterium]MCX7589840.1 UvrD-helicase domain-containing protein [Patescibacteria group bacterium]MDW8279921.1 UvrD-helicase domain-containing protein [bacterium]